MIAVMIKGYCDIYAEDDFNNTLLGCGVGNLIGFVCGAGIPTAFLATCVCIGFAYDTYTSKLSRCQNDFDRCLDSCMWN